MLNPLSFSLMRKIISGILLNAKIQFICNVFLGLFYTSQADSTLSYFKRKDSPHVKEPNAILTHNFPSLLHFDYLQDYSPRSKNFITKKVWKTCAGREFQFSKRHQTFSWRARVFVFRNGKGWIKLPLSIVSTRNGICDKRR